MFDKEFVIRKVKGFCARLLKKTQKNALWSIAADL